MKQLSERGFERVAEQFRLLGDPGRLKMLDLVRRHGELSVGEVAASIECSHAHASRQLARLHRAGLLGRRRQGTAVFYHPDAPWVFELCETVCGRIEEASEPEALFAK